MTKREVAFLGCRLLALYFIVCSLGYSGWLVALVMSLFPRPMGGGPSGWTGLAFSGLYSVAFGVMGLLLWVYAQAFARYLTGRDEADQPASGLAGHDGQAIVFGGIGMLTLVQGLPRLAAGTISTIFASPGSTGPLRYQQPEGEIAAGLVMVVLGFLVLRNARKLARLLWPHYAIPHTDIYMSPPPPPVVTSAPQTDEPLAP